MSEHSTPSARVTMAQVGRKCGYHPSTVGLALRNHPDIAESTRRTILKAAKEMGYTPDPALSSLIAHRRALKAPSGYSTIAIISDLSPPDRWRKIHHTGQEYFEGMKSQADRLGYKLDEFSIGREHRMEQRIDDILKARGIRSVIVTPLRSIDLPVSIDWESFCAIAIGHSLANPVLPCVTHQHRTGAQTAVKELLRLGYRRIALVLPYTYDKRVGFGWSAGFFGTSHLYRDRVECMCHYTTIDDDLCVPEVAEWIRQNRPEVVVTSQQHFHKYLRQLGYRIPEDIGFVQLDCNPDVAEISGINQNSAAVGRSAVDWIAMLQSGNRRGLPSVQEVRLITGQWMPGETVRRVGPSLID